MDEEAYKVLQTYLEKIQQQLATEEYADDIYKDIELRIAELLFALSSNEQRAISIEQLNDIIEQVGFIDSEETSEPTQRKSYRDPQNKIMGGVCAGLATRFGVPAFILRLVFLSLIMFFGLGVALYIIFWIALDTNSDRNTALAAQGKAQTARHIATSKAPKEGPFMQLQRIIFLPFSIIGALVRVIGSHFVKRKNVYFFLIKSVVALGLLFALIIAGTIIYSFNHSQLFSLPVSWALSISAMYLIVLALAFFLKKFYLERPNFKIKSSLKQGALVPVGMIAAAIAFQIYVHQEHETESVEKSFSIDGNHLALTFNEKYPTDHYARRVSYQVKTHDLPNKKVNLRIQYSSSGVDAENVSENIQSMDYYFTYENDALTLNKFWVLKEGALNREQHLDVIIEVPQDIVMTSSWPLLVDRDSDSYSYLARDTHEAGGDYFVRGDYIHEFSKDFKNKLSENERDVLNGKFCEEFFISDYWSCYSNIRHSVSDNYRFDRAFQQDMEAIEQMREFLLPDRSLFVSNLSKMHELVNGLSVEYAVKSDFQIFIEQLLKVKALTPSKDSTNSVNDLQENHGALVEY
nr:PspC domain-containing protein [Pleionea sp. CnH1-48]